MKVDHGGLGGQPTDRVRMILPAKLLVLFAYNLLFWFREEPGLGGPEWLASDQYEIQAKIEQLVPSKAPVDVIVIDHIEGPSAN
jgi:hypothetical protein